MPCAGGQVDDAWVPSMAIPESSKAVEVVELDHPVMDVKDKMQGSKGIDVVKLTANSDGTQLKTTALLHKEVKEYITDSAGLTLAVYLDTDNNKQLAERSRIAGRMVLSPVLKDRLGSTKSW